MLLLPNTRFKEKHGETLNFSNCRVNTEDGRRGLRDEDHELIHKKVLTHLETAFGIECQHDGSRGLLTLPETLDKEAVILFL